ncbi:MAG: MaoC/PaaZ C-terminal domain-containing protein [Smithella sp.]|nr:MaoC/PaaZ C-terminal domain-containing protein [Smithella sp.]
MENHWNLLKEVSAGYDGDIRAVAEVPVDSEWFSGHFPGEPILPGIALIHMVEQAIIQEAQARGISLQVRTLKRVKFLRPVRPGSTLWIGVNIENNQNNFMFSFKVMEKENIVCSGSMAAKKIIDGEGGI